MRKIFIIMCMLCVAAVAYCQQTDTIKFYTTWDDLMLYVAVSAQGPDLRAVHKEFNSPTEGDDGLELFLNLSDDRTSAAYTDKTAYISVSAAGGFEFRRGNGTALEQEKLFSHRYGVDVQGNLNDPGNIDSGYSIELAIPWSELGGSNMSYKSIGIDFRITVCGKSYCLSGPDTFMQPDKCWDLLLSKFSTLSTKGTRKIVSNHYMAEPRINGELKENEWYSRTAYVIEVPVEGDDPYALIFADQPLRSAVFDPREGTRGILDDPRRAGWLKESIAGLVKNEGADALVIPADNPFICQIAEALKACLAEGTAAATASPSLFGCDDPEGALLAFYSAIPEQLRRTALDSEGHIGYPVYTDEPDEELAGRFAELFGRRPVFRSGADLKAESAAERPKKAYSYIISSVTMPAALDSRTGRQASIVIKNTGTLTWKSGEAALAYKWYVGGRFFSEGLAPVPIMKDVAPGGLYQMNTALAPMSDKRKPLPEGEAVCELDLITQEDGKSMAKPDGDTFIFRTVIQKSAPSGEDAASKAALKELREQAPKPYVVSADEPCLVAPGGSYRVILQVCNTTLEGWTPDNVYAEARVCVLDSSGREEYSGPKARLELRDDTPDGTIGAFDGYLDTGKLRLISPGSGHVCVIRYTLGDKKKRVDLREHRMLTADRDDNQRIIALKAPEKNGDDLTVTLGVRNAGIRKWPLATTFITASLYSPEGVLIKKDLYKGLLSEPGKKKKTLDPGETVERVISFRDDPDLTEGVLVVELTDDGEPFGNSVLEKPADRLILEPDAE
ncbi:MAG: hypothetical protein IK083_01940 [Abditibacteriota bacterium]|nr:hypothetical protein [Abditibacteriota bacterium]